MILVGLLSALPGAAPASDPAASTSCAAPVHVKAVGLACLTGNGNYRITLSDGRSLLTHGPDPMRVSEGEESLFFTRLKPLGPSCVSDPSKQFHVQLIYAKPSGVSSTRFPKILPKIHDLIGRVNAMLTYEAKEFGMSSMRYRMACSGGKVPSLLRVNLTENSKSTSFTSVVEAVRHAGYTNPLTKYWIWVDTTIAGAGGVSDLTEDDRALPENGNNMGPNYAAFFGILGGFGAEIVMHEASHGLGAVQESAPNVNQYASEPGFRHHCLDDPDVMCYSAAADEFYRPNSCPRVHFDCRHNDYFNPRPSSKNYLATHWNLGSPLNRYFAGCAYTSGLMTVGTGGVDVDSAVRGVKPDWTRLAWTSASVSKGCWGHPFAASGITLPPALPGALLPSSMGLISGAQTAYPARRVMGAVPVDVDVCFFKGSAQLRCYAAGAFEKGTVPSGTTSARVIVAKGAQVSYAFSVL